MGMVRMEDMGWRDEGRGNWGKRGVWVGVLWGMKIGVWEI